MRFQRYRKIVHIGAALLVIALVFLSGCATVPQQDHSALIERKPRSIVVIPPANRSVEVNAPYTYLATISKPLAEKGYYVFPVAVIDNFLKENGLPTPAEMNSVPLDKIRENIGADAALYVTIFDWGQKYQVINSSAVVKAKLRLVDTRDGTLLWEAWARGERSSESNGDNGLLGAIVSAAVTQIAGSLTDYTYDLSRKANNAAINNADNGLLKGPYRQDPTN